MKSKLASIMATVIASTAAVSAIATPVKAASLGTVLGLAAGGAAAGIIIDRNIKAEHDRYAYHSPEVEYDRGLQDGEQRVKYDNPRNSDAYDRGYDKGMRLSRGWLDRDRDFH